MIRLLLVEDDDAVRRLLERLISMGTAAVTTCKSGEEALELLRQDRYPIVLLDYQLPGINGITLARHIREEHAGTITVMITGYATLSLAVNAGAAGVVDVIDKSLNLSEISERLRTAISSVRHVGNLDIWLDRQIANLSDRPGLRIADLSEETGISVRLIRGILRRAFAQSFRERLRSHRIAAVKRLLTDPTKSIKEVSAEGGFSSQARMCEAFRESVGCTATEFRQRK